MYFENTSGRLQHPTDIHTFPFLTFFCHFQVVSERLFSTPQSSSSSLTGSSGSQGPLQPQEPHYRAHGENRKWTCAKNLKLIVIHCVRTESCLVVCSVVVMEGIACTSTEKLKKIKIFSSTAHCVLECSWKVPKFVTQEIALTLYWLVFRSRRRYYSKWKLRWWILWWWNVKDVTTTSKNL